jgi:hypothetical protein
LVVIFGTVAAAGLRSDTWISAGSRDCAAAAAAADTGTGIVVVGECRGPFGRQ